MRFAVFTNCYNFKKHRTLTSSCILVCVYREFFLSKLCLGKKIDCYGLKTGQIIIRSVHYWRYPSAKKLTNIKHDSKNSRKRFAKSRNIKKTQILLKLYFFNIRIFGVRRSDVGNKIRNHKIIYLTRRRNFVRVYPVIPWDCNER